MRVIIPCAGKSTRFPVTRPKYLLTMPDGELMLQHSARNWLESNDVTFVIAREHDIKYSVTDTIRRIYGNAVDIHVVEEFTNGPAETIYETIKDWEDCEFYVQDCDSHFDVSFAEYAKNSIVYVDLNDYPTFSNVAAKSFVKFHEDLVSTIVEKSVVSNNVCVGGYKFESSDYYKKSYDIVKSILADTEIFISHVIKLMITEEVPFFGSKASRYVDCGTYQSYVDNQQANKTIFCDLDGVIFKNQSHYFENNYSIAPEINKAAVAYLLKQHINGATIVFTTSRPEEFRKITTDALDSAGFSEYKILFDLPHAPRLLINDYAITNPYPSASCLNVSRDDDDIWKTLTK